MKPSHLDLGLAISGHYSTFGVSKTQAEIANFCTWNPTKKEWTTISRQRIDQIEHRALRKIRKYLHCHPEVRNELAEIFGLTGL